ncbi:iron-sulfur cluster-binding protein [Candidatus Desantisbacteria bacterium CG2_30_40_21]|uniref:Iron-sulfur cluster-binding protein n=5 Tax=unclassified Candidatus Desantisiibacteriota TaxID=3106372 RepID=A0A2M7JBV9_9BACT|nr:MAG: iron-sulfur cluster-binding protein [Candidatus Desantisbacteria bacterium CG2_30_40_21]PIP41648.1 MAG: iron-sulfur cluster-binding protein [Candidatus Desantisbacteria bacterium CG23_combo_of_CG06-09_8_20_14_all_40_23]PIX16878.1 MAG: iron-sulfur cluster-binding protein [Candidatus Desantisbacteria bacterium CG_4_8_14_3_um_filter_40_12]PIY19525.1 MAG: iron-sulfur cluster-binding protein [Candidatus Desantisbacteria bacterium CG_4_10_14_3_um_filter_40_18]PJB29064.1 MAG: iron-sulfur clust
MAKSKVAILRTTPATVLHDYHRLMNLADYQDILPKDVDTALKINISWHFFYPGSSTTPWQLEGVIRAMKKDGYNADLIHACHNRTVVIDAHLGERENKQINVINAHGLKNVHLYEGEEWIHIRDAVGSLTDKFLCLNEVYPKGFMIPKRFIGENIIHLPTIKTHVFTTTTGAMKNAFGGLLNEKRHWAHPVIHETLVDLLMIQKKIHRGVFAVMDGTFAGDGPGPRCMIPHVKNVILASNDQVAIDAVAAMLMGFDPLRDIKFIRLAHDLGLGCGDISEIEIVGDIDAAKEKWHFVGPFKKMTFASRMQHFIYWGKLKKPVEWTLKTILAPWAYIASILYHDVYWYPAHQERIFEILNSPWGRLFHNWENITLPPDDLDISGWNNVGTAPAKLNKETMKLISRSFKVLGTCIKEAPEFGNRKRIFTTKTQRHEEI